MVLQHLSQKIFYGLETQKKASLTELSE